MSTTLPKVAADFSQSLLSSVLAGATTATLNSANDADGNVLTSGKYCLTVDIDASTKEYIVADLVGTALTNIQNISRQGVVTTGFAVYHRAGASVTISDWAVLYRLIYDLTTTNALDAGLPLGYDAAPAGLTGNNLATVAYVLSVVNGGAVTFDQQVIGGETAGETLLLHDHVYLKEADGKWYKVSASTSSTFQELKRGIALGAANTNASVTIAISGPIPGFSGLSTGSKYYASNTGGLISASAGTNTVFVGWALSTTILLLSPLGRDIPYGNEKDALAGTIGTPSSSNKYVTKFNSFIDIDQSQTTQDTTSAVGEANATTKKNEVAQSFTPTYPGIRGAKLYKAADTGSFTGTMTVALQADSTGSPSGSNLASVVIPNATWLLIPVGEFFAEFSSEYLSLVPGTLYWLVVSTSTADTSNHPNLNYAVAGGYAGGSAKYNNTTDGWVPITNADFYFKTLDPILSQVAVADPTRALVPVSILPSGLIDMDTSTSTLASSTTETTVYAKQIPVSAFRLNSGISIVVFGDTRIDTSTRSLTVRIKLNGTTVSTLTLTATTSNALAASFKGEIFILNNNSLSSQKVLSWLIGMLNNQNGAAGDTNAIQNYVISNSGTASVDTSVAVVLTVTFQLSNSASTMTYDYNGAIVSKVGI